MQKRNLENLLAECEALFRQEGRLIEPESERVIFAGDTHGDIDATRGIIQKYLKNDTSIVFLGDYVDRGSHSAKNLHTLLELKLKYPAKIFLLMGNHEGIKAIQFHPTDFWAKLPTRLHHQYAETLSHLPFAASTPNGIIALHGALPDVETLADINRIEFGSREWRQITWGDWQEDGSEAIFAMRPRFDGNYFEEIMKRFGKDVLVRSHQPDIDPVTFGRKCLTIFTTDAYGFAGRERTVAVADMREEIKTVDDLQIDTI